MSDWAPAWSRHFDGRVICDEQGRQVAYVADGRYQRGTAGERPPSFTAEQIEARGALITAAPDMYAAIEEAVTFLLAARIAKEASVSQIAPVLEQLTGALAQARGEEAPDA